MVRIDQLAAPYLQAAAEHGFALEPSYDNRRKYVLKYPQDVSYGPSVSLIFTASKNTVEIKYKNTRSWDCPMTTPPTQGPSAFQPRIKAISDDGGYILVEVGGFSGTPEDGLEKFRELLEMAPMMFD